MVHRASVHHRICDHMVPSILLEESSVLWTRTMHTIPPLRHIIMP